MSGIFFARVHAASKRNIHAGLRLPSSPHGTSWTPANLSSAKAVMAESLSTRYYAASSATARSCSASRVLPATSATTLVTVATRGIGSDARGSDSFTLLTAAHALRKDKCWASGRMATVKVG